LVVRMRREPTSGAIDAASTEQRLRVTYGNATYPAR
jgi:hypothetical protein